MTTGIVKLLRALEIRVLGDAPDPAWAREQEHARARGARRLAASLERAARARAVGRDSGRPGARRRG